MSIKPIMENWEKFVTEDVETNEQQKPRAGSPESRQLLLQLIAARVQELLKGAEIKPLNIADRDLDELQDFDEDTINSLKSDYFKQVIDLHIDEIATIVKRQF